MAKNWKKINIEEYQDTLHHCYSLRRYLNLSETKKYEIYHQEVNKKYKKKFRSTQVEVVDDDTINATIDLFQETNESRPKILVLNMASNRVFGGGVKTGANAQEEALFRKTDYGLHPGAILYPLKAYEYTYTPNVTIVKKSIDDGTGNLLASEKLDEDELFSVDMIAMPAIKKPNLINGKLSQIDLKIMYAKIDNIFKRAITRKREYLVLGALGCGAYKNPPIDIIKIFNIILEKYNGYFKKIVFAVLGGNTKNFEYFNKYITRLKKNE